MIESRYSIEYVETDAHQQKSFSLLKLMAALLVVAGMGLFAYSTITGTPMEGVLNQPVSFIKDRFLSASRKSTAVDNDAVASSADNDADNNLDNSLASPLANANTEIEAELKNTIGALEEKLQTLTAEKDIITQRYNDLLKEKKLLEKTAAEQLTDNKALQENLQRIKEKLAEANKDNIKLSEQIAIQQVENETLSSLLESSQKEKEAKEEAGKEVVAISKPETPATASLTEDQKDTALDSDIIVETASEKPAPVSEKTATAEDSKSTITNTKEESNAEESNANDDAGKQAKTESAPATPEPVQEAVISSDVDAIVKAMQGTKE